MGPSDTHTGQGKRGCVGLKLLLGAGWTELWAEKQQWSRAPRNVAGGGYQRRGCMECYQDSSEGRLWSLTGTRPRPGQPLTPAGSLHGESCLPGRLGAYRCLNVTSERQNGHFHSFPVCLTRFPTKQVRGRERQTQDLPQDLRTLWKPKPGARTGLPLV